jgi:hypothetical protein
MEGPEGKSVPFVYSVYSAVKKNQYSKLTTRATPP